MQYVKMILEHPSSDSITLVLLAVVAFIAIWFADVYASRTMGSEFWYRVYQLFVFAIVVLTFWYAPAAYRELITYIGYGILAAFSLKITLNVGWGI